MKIEMGESLMQSYLRHVKGCLLTQTNWRTSASWNNVGDGFEHAKSIFNKIQSHEDLSDVFKSSFEQTLKQAELDVVGIGNKTLYMVEVAFHENGLQYGNKSETKDRVCKKLLRAYLVGLSYFPGFSYEILFASPKVNPATDRIIREYFSILNKDFGGGKVTFRYIANDEFKNDVLIPILRDSSLDSDSSELFLRSVKMLEMFGFVDIKNVEANSDGIVSKLTSPKDETDHDSLRRDIQTIGMKTFVDYYHLFVNPSCTNQEIKHHMHLREKWSENSLDAKVFTGLKIIRENKGKEALRIISQSNRISRDTQEKPSCYWNP